MENFVTNYYENNEKNEFVFSKIYGEWKDRLMTHYKINENDTINVCKFIYNYLPCESKEAAFLDTDKSLIENNCVLSELSKVLLHLNLKVISKISFISNVIFLESPNTEEVIIKHETDDNNIIVINKNKKLITTETYMNKIKVEKGLVNDMDALLEIENAIVSTVASEINRGLFEYFHFYYNKIYIYRPIAYFKFIPGEENNLNNENKKVYDEIAIFSKWYKDIKNKI